MIASFRRLSKSTVGTIIMAFFFVMILVGFALQDVRGTLGGGIGQMAQGTLAEAGDEKLLESELSAQMQRRLTEVRQQNPTADYSALREEFGPMLDALIQQKAIADFASGQDIHLSKRLIDAEIARLPQTRGLDGRFSEEAYARLLAQLRMSDADVRQEIRRTLLNRIMLVPANAGARVPVGVARPYAAMQLEVREAGTLLIPTESFLPSIGTPSDAQVADYYKRNVARYMVPEQRSLNVAKIGPEQVAKVAASDAEIAAYYKANAATYGSKVQRVISQVVVPSKANADQLAAKLRSGTSFVDAAKPLGFSAADISVGPQTKDEFAGKTNAAVADAAFAADVGANGIVGPVRSDLGWHVIKIDGIKELGGKSLEAARGEIAEKLNADKRKEALGDLIARIEDAIADGKNFAEALAGTGIEPIRTPLVIGTGKSISQPSYTVPAELAPALRSGFELGQGDDPVVETLPDDAGYALVGVDQIVPASPAPLAEIRARVANDFKLSQARDQARKVAEAIAAKVAKGSSLPDAVAATRTPVSLPTPVKTKIRRIELAQMQGQIPPAINLMFSLPEGKSRMIADPQGRGFIVVRVTKITPGDVTLQPGLLAQLQREFQSVAGDEYAEQFVNGIVKDVGVKRNDKAIAEARNRILGGGAN